MEISSIIIILVIALAAALFVSSPFNRASGPDSAGANAEPANPSTVTPDYHTDTNKERSRLMDSLRELDQDNLLGKIPAEDYAPRRETLLRSLAEILRQQEESGLGSPTP